MALFKRLGVRELSPAQQRQWDQGAAVIKAKQYTLRPSVSAQMEQLCGPRFDLYSEIERKDEEYIDFSGVEEAELAIVGAGLLRAVAPLIGVEASRAEAAEVVGTIGVFLAPGAEMDKHHDRRNPVKGAGKLVRLTAVIRGGGSFWSEVTGEVATRVADVAAQDLELGPLHQAINRGSSPRITTVWDIEIPQEDR